MLIGVEVELALVRIDLCFPSISRLLNQRYEKVAAPYHNKKFQCTTEYKSLSFKRFFLLQVMFAQRFRSDEVLGTQFVFTVSFLGKFVFTFHQEKREKKFV